MQAALRSLCTNEVEKLNLPFLAIFLTVSRLLIRAISNLALQQIEKVTDVSRNSVPC